MDEITSTIVSASQLDVSVQDYPLDKDGKLSEPSDDMKQVNSTLLSMPHKAAGGLHAVSN